MLKAILFEIYFMIFRIEAFLSQRPDRLIKSVLKRKDPVDSLKLQYERAKALQYTFPEKSGILLNNILKKTNLSSSDQHGLEYAMEDIYFRLATLTQDEKKKLAYMEKVLHFNPNHRQAIINYRSLKGESVFPLVRKQF